jgi:ketosteroid isomerase-like protein
MRVRSFVAGMALATIARGLLVRLLLVKFSRDVRLLNGGDHSTLLKAYAEDAVLHFNEGDHRFSGEWAGRRNIDRFLQNFTAAQVRGEIKQLALSGPLWRLTMFVRFDDHAEGPDGTRLYENRTALVLRTRWGRIVEQDDFYFDTTRIAAFDRKLAELGVEPVGKVVP